MFRSRGYARWGKLPTWLMPALGLACVLHSHGVLAQPGSTPGIYTCIDARGRKLTSDRPIADCVDREQHVLNPSGTVRDRIGPSLTVYEKNLIEAKERAQKEELARIGEEKRRDRALLARYPNQAAHDSERSEALVQIGVVRQAAVHRVEELLRRRTAVQAEMEFYKTDPSKAPVALRRRSDEVTLSLAVQGRFIADQDAELKRTNARFDEELLRLRQLWAPPPQPSSPTKAR